MCLGVPGRIVEIVDDAGLAMAMVDFGGVRRRCCLAYLPDAAVGDYAIIHVGFAIALLDEAAALDALAAFAELGGPDAADDAAGSGASGSRSWAP